MIPYLSCLVPSHYPNQWWLDVSWTCKKKISVKFESEKSNFYCIWNSLLQKKGSHIFPASMCLYYVTRKLFISHGVHCISSVIPYRVLVFPRQKLGGGSTTANGWISMSGTIGETPHIAIPKHTLDFISEVRLPGEIWGEIGLDLFYDIWHQVFIYILMASIRVQLQYLRWLVFIIKSHGLTFSTRISVCWQLCVLVMITLVCHHGGWWSMC